MFTGSIYNPGCADGKCILDLYAEHGDEFSRHLDGDFAVALVDYAGNKLVISTDAFGTKPLFYAFENGEFALSTYESPLRRLGLMDTGQLARNTVLSYALTSLTNERHPRLLRRGTVRDFDLLQRKGSAADWETAFEAAVLKVRGPSRPAPSLPPHARTLTATARTLHPHHPHQRVDKQRGRHKPSAPVLLLDASDPSAAIACSLAAGEAPHILYRFQDRRAGGASKAKGEGEGEGGAAAGAVVAQRASWGMDFITRARSMARGQLVHDELQAELFQR